MRYLSIIVVMGMVIATMTTLATAMGADRTGSSFSPQELWTYTGRELNSTVGSWSSRLYWDVNSDQKAEIMLTIQNYSSKTFEIEILNGADGNVLARNIFADTGYVENGDVVALEPTLFGETITDSSGTPITRHNWVVFTNNSDNHHISIYRVNNITLANQTYREIVIPSQLNYGMFTGSVDLHSSSYAFHPLSWGNDAYLFYIGYYVAPVYGNYGIFEIRMMMMDANLNTVWEKTEKSLGDVSIPEIGADITSFNGWGLNGDTSDIIYVNLTASPGNTTLEGIDNTNGNVLWITTVPGVFFFDPTSAMDSPWVYQIDYNHDKRVDLALETINIHTNETNVYFIKSDGTLLGFASLGTNKFALYAIFTDYKIPSQFHTIFRTIDVNGDGNGEVFIVDNNTESFCWDIANNKSLWSIPMVNQSYRYGIYLSTSDLNNDNVWDIYLMGMNDTDTGKKVNLTAVDSYTGHVIWNKIYEHLVGGFPGMSVLRELSDIDGDGIQDVLVTDGYYNDGLVYVNLSVISLKDGSIIWTNKVSSGLNNNDYGNWSTYAFCTGDINGDGTNDVMVELIYHPEMSNVVHYWSYLRVLSGVNGTLLWTGEVTDDRTSTDAESFIPVTLATNWSQFDYNDDGIENEMLITTGFSVQIYAVMGVIPEFNFEILMIFVSIVFMAVTAYYRKH